jgi:hypothetical protein
MIDEISPLLAEAIIEWIEDSYRPAPLRNFTLYKRAPKAPMPWNWRIHQPLTNYWRASSKWPMYVQSQYVLQRKEVV